VEAGSALRNGVIRIIGWLLAKGRIRALRRREGAFEGKLDAYAFAQGDARRPGRQMSNALPRRKRLAP